MLDKKPSAVHLAIAECEARLKKQGRSVVVITQCQDDLHRQAGSKHVLKIHGECWWEFCCKEICKNMVSRFLIFFSLHILIEQRFLIL